MKAVTHFWRGLEEKAVWPKEVNELGAKILGELAAREGIEEELSIVEALLKLSHDLVRIYRSQRELQLEQR